MLGASCSNGDGDGAAKARPRSTAKITVVTPKAASVSGATVAVSLRLDGGRITKQVTTNLRPDRGHVHLRLDGETITLLGSLTERIPDVKAGPHLLEAEFVASDHGPFNPRVLSAVSFTVR
jgi:hypothetical protein